MKKSPPVAKPALLRGVGSRSLLRAARRSDPYASLPKELAEGLRALNAEREEEEKKEKEFRNALAKATKNITNQQAKMAKAARNNRNAVRSTYKNK